MLRSNPTPLLKIFFLVTLLTLALNARPARAQSGAPTSEGPRADRVREASGEKGARGDLSGRIVGEGGEPFSSVTVLLINMPSASGGPRIPRGAVSDEDGNFVFKDLAPGVYRISANEVGHVANFDRQGARLVQSFRPGDFASIQLFKGGVITGTVTDATGEPVVAMGVRAYRVRDLNNQPVAAQGFGFLPATESQTDDRGVYRIYGLPPGVYVVSADGASARPWGANVSALEGEAPTFHPSSTRDTAAEITVRAGQEATGIDVRYRGEPGHRITGTVATMQSGQDASTLPVRLNDATTNMHMATAIAAHGTGSRAFSFEGVADGDYDLWASRFGPDGRLNVSPIQRVSVRGADATGIRLTLAPLASVRGSLIIERLAPDGEPEACRQQGAPVLPQEILVAAQPSDASRRARPRATERVETTPDESGAFTILNLEAGSYRIEIDAPGERLYLTAIQMPRPASARTGADAPRSANRTRAASAGDASAPAAAFNVGDGQQLAGLTIRFKEGAARLSGHVVPSLEAAASPVASSLRLYLVPVERERADDPLRYHEATPSADHSFTLKNLAPGRYHLLAREAANSPADAPPSLHDADFRAALRRDAETAGLPLELQPCQTLTGFTLRFPHAK